MSENTVYFTTIQYDYCSGCGVCECVCPTKAIAMSYSNNLNYLPTIDKDRCINCGKCVEYCPNSIVKKNSLQENLKAVGDPITVGINDAIAFYRTVVRKKEDLMRSASGGFATAFAQMLLREKVIDCVIHAERALATVGEPHFIACVSYTEDDLDNRRSSIYGPVTFNNVITKFENDRKNILAIGVPCAISGIKHIFENDKRYSGNKLYTMSLVCSHNVTGQFVDFLAQYYGIDKDTKFTVNMRGKNHNMKNRDSFHLHYTGEDGKRIIDEGRTVFNPLWRNYYFAMDACHYCGDLWGMDADVSCKDCWDREGDRDQYGSSLVIFRNEGLNRLFLRMKETEVECLSFDRVRYCEYPAAVYKQKQFCNHLNGDFGDVKFFENSRMSKQIYDEKGYHSTLKYLQPILDECFKPKKSIKSSIKKGLKKTAHMLHIPHGVIQMIKPKLKILKSIVKYDKKHYDKILMLGGFDGGNAGDEAQIDSTVNLIMNRYPGYIVKVLSHVPYYTWTHHYHCCVGPNPRMYLWDMDDNSWLYAGSGLKKKIDRFRFLAKGYWACFNAYLVRCNLPVLFLNAKRATILQDIKTSDLLYISGGGSMTGDTLSRCWDNVFCMKLARIFKVPFVMSGQNSGNWDSKFTERFVSKVMNQAQAITLRDALAIENLKKIGVDRDCVFTMFDDALFCDKQADVSYELKQIDVTGEYLVLNIHYWGCEKDLEEQKELLNRLACLCDYMFMKTNLDILLLPMSDTDVQPIEDLIGIYEKPYLKALRVAEYDFRLIRGIIAGAQYCVTMKHHPIIFAIGEGVPTLSIAYKPYYTYKNLGALKIFNMEKYGIDLEKNNYFEMFTPLFDDLIEHHDKLSDQIRKSLDEIRPRREKLFSIIDGILLK